MWKCIENCKMTMHIHHGEVLEESTEQYTLSSAYTHCGNQAFIKSWMIRTWITRTLFQSAPRKQSFKPRLSHPWYWTRISGVSSDSEFCNPNWGWLPTCSWGKPMGLISNCCQFSVMASCLPFLFQAKNASSPAAISKRHTQVCILTPSQDILRHIRTSSPSSLWQHLVGWEIFN